MSWVISTTTKFKPTEYSQRLKVVDFSGGRKTGWPGEKLSWRRSKPTDTLITMAFSRVTKCQSGKKQALYALVTHATQIILNDKLLVVEVKLTEHPSTRRAARIVKEASWALSLGSLG